MSQDIDKDKYNNEERKKTRRTRKDQEGRNFTCPCGKSYLSYPALYTHIKTKHQGKAPKEDAGAVSKAEAEQENETKEPLSQVKEMIDKYFPGDDIAAYPTPLSREDSEYIKGIMDGWESVKDSRLEDTSNNSNESINNIFARFLSQMKPQIKAQGYMYLCQFICCFQRGIAQEKKDKDYCKDNNGTQLPHFFNQFIIRKRAPSLQSKKGSPTANLLLACKILFAFGSWIFEQRYTNFSVKYNSLAA